MNNNSELFVLCIIYNFLVDQRWKKSSGHQLQENQAACAKLAQHEIVQFTNNSSVSAEAVETWEERLYNLIIC